MIMTQDKARKAAIRYRMAQTGEPYSVARHAVEREDLLAAPLAPANAGSSEPAASVPPLQVAETTLYRKLKEYGIADPMGE